MRSHSPARAISRRSARVVDMDGGGWDVCTSAACVTGLAMGQHLFRVRLDGSDESTE